MQQNFEKIVLSTKEAAEYLGMSKCALDKSRATGQLFNTEAPPFIKYGRSVRYKKTSLDEWLSNNNKSITTAEYYANNTQ